MTTEREGDAIDTDVGGRQGRTALYLAGALVAAGALAVGLALDPGGEAAADGGAAGAPEAARADRFEPGRPAAVGPADLWGAFRRAGEVGSLHSLLVSQDGQLVGERYFDGASASDVINVKSVSKSVMSALVGAAVGGGHLEGPNQLLAELLPEAYEGVDDPRKRWITVGNLLSNQAGLETTSFDNYGPWVSSGDWVRWALRQPVECPPGTCWEYSTGNFHLLSAALTRATGMSTREFARRELLGPLGIPARPWDRDPQGVYLGGNNMGFTPRELLRFGELYLAGGRWQGQQLVPASWVERSLQPRVRSSYNGNAYGYGWWSRRIAGERTWYAWGYGGQYLILVPRLGLAMVATTAPGRRGGRWDADRAIFRILREEVIPRARTRDGGTPTAADGARRR